MKTWATNLLYTRSSRHGLEESEGQLEREGDEVDGWEHRTEHKAFSPVAFCCVRLPTYITKQSASVHQ